MGVLDLKIYPDPILRKSCEEVKTFDNELRNFVSDMYETMHDNAGIGLAANQVGSLKRLFVLDLSAYDEEKKFILNQQEAELAENIADIDHRDTAKNEDELSIPESNLNKTDEEENEEEDEGEALPPRPICVINPKIINADGEVIYNEGCLSFPGVREEVKRYGVVTLRYQNEHGQPVEGVFENIAAVCIQHELDHLNGIMFFDRLPVIKRKIITQKFLKSLKLNESS